jgi:hypothetical protein
MTKPEHPGLLRAQIVEPLRAHMGLHKKMPGEVVIRHALMQLKMLPNYRLVLANLIDRLGKQHRVCWPSKKTIAKDCGVSDRTVLRAVNLASEAGWLRIHPRTTPYGTISNEYAFLPAILEAITGEPASLLQVAEGDRVSQGGVTDCHGGGCQTVMGGDDKLSRKAWNIKPGTSSLELREEKRREEGKSPSLPSSSSGDRLTLTAQPGQVGRQVVGPVPGDGSGDVDRQAGQVPQGNAGQGQDNQGQRGQGQEDQGHVQRPANQVHPGDGGQPHAGRQAGQVSQAAREDQAAGAAWKIQLKVQANQAPFGLNDDQVIPSPPYLVRVPEQYAGWTFHRVNKALVGFIMDDLTSPGGSKMITLHSKGSGTMKSSVAAATLQHSVNEGWPGYTTKPDQAYVDRVMGKKEIAVPREQFVTWPEFKEGTTPLAAGDGMSRDDRWAAPKLFLERLKRVQFLVLDDVLSETGRAGKLTLDALSDLIHERASAGRMTILTTNRTRQQVVERLGEAIADRMGDCVVEFTGPSRRAVDDGNRRPDPRYMLTPTGRMPPEAPGPEMPPPPPAPESPQAQAPVATRPTAQEPSPASPGAVPEETAAFQAALAERRAASPQAPPQPAGPAPGPTPPTPPTPAGPEQKHSVAGEAMLSSAEEDAMGVADVLLENLPLFKHIPQVGPTKDLAVDALSFTTACREAAKDPELMVVCLLQKYNQVMAKVTNLGVDTGMAEPGFLADRRVFEVLLGFAKGIDP